MNTKKISKSIFILLLTTSSMVFAQFPKTGIYDMGAICKSDSGFITGYIRDGVGDEELGSPVRSCFIYFSGKIFNKQIRIDLWEIKEKKIDKYKADIITDTKMKGNYIIIAKYVPNYGICSTSTFTKKDSLYYSSMLFIKETNWKSILLINNDNVSIYENKNKSRVITSLNFSDPVKVLIHDIDWLKIEIDNGLTGWIQSKDVYNITL